VDVGTLLIPGAQPLEDGQPDEAAFDHPTLPAQAVIKDKDTFFNAAETMRGSANLNEARH